MPKQKITKEMVVEAAFELAQEGGSDQILVKNIAEKLGCSVQPIYSYCKSMEGLRLDVVKRTKKFVQDYIAAHIHKDDFFRSTGYAYIRLAMEEPNIFQIFILHKRDKIASLDDLYKSDASPKVAEMIAQDLKISIQRAKMLHMNMLIYTIGIGTILATASPGIPEGEITGRIEAAYEAFLKQTLEQGREEA